MKKSEIEFVLASALEVVNTAALLEDLCYNKFPEEVDPEVVTRLLNETIKRSADQIIVQLESAIAELNTREKFTKNHPGFFTEPKTENSTRIREAIPLAFTERAIRDINSLQA